MRPIGEPFVVATPTGARIRDRLRVSDHDADVLWLVGNHLGRLAGRDLATRCRLGKAAKHEGRTERKKSLTPESSSRWAGAITRTSADQWERGFKNLLDDRASLSEAIRVIEARLKAPVGEKQGRTRGYSSQAERAQKQQRLQMLQTRLVEVQDRITSGRVSVIRGGSRVLNTRHNLATAGLTEDEWAQRWRSDRLFLTADGDKAYRFGNGLIAADPDTGNIQITLPRPLTHLSNTPGRSPTYRLSCTVKFKHRADEWKAQACTGAVRYDIAHDPTRDRWYVDASWQTRPDSPPSLDELRLHRTIGVDLNADHLACWALSPDGNPVGPGHIIPLHLDGDTARRDGQLREAISRLLDIADTHGCRSISIENLNFADARATGRETMGRGPKGKRFRRTVSGIPTSKFRTRLVGMASNRGLAIIAIDPAYTSKWGGQHWQAPLNTSHTSKNSTEPVTRHLAASVVIGRRSLGHKARRRTEKTGRHQRMPNGDPSSRPNQTPDTARNPDPGQGDTHQHLLEQTCPPEPDSPGNQASQHRSETPTRQDSLLLSG